MVQVGYSELILLDHDVEENVRRLLAAGADHVELMMDAGGWEAFHGQYGALARRLRASGVAFTVHPAAWDINLTSELEVMRRAAWDHHLAALEFSAELGARQMVVHPGLCSFNKDTARGRAHEIILSLAERAKPLGVRLAFENVGCSGNWLYDQRQFFHALDDVDGIVGYLIDMGHAHVNGWDIPAAIRTAGPRLFGVHIHDNHGTADEHLPIGRGTIPWADVWQALRDGGAHQCEYVLEYAPGTPLERLTEGKAQILEALR